MSYRIVHVGTGNVGKEALRAILRRPDLELVGHRSRQHVRRATAPAFSPESTPDGRRPTWLSRPSPQRIASISSE